MGELYLTTQGMFRLAWRVPQPILRTLFISSLQYHSCPQALHALTAFGVALAPARRHALPGTESRRPALGPQPGPVSLS